MWGKPHEERKDGVDALYTLWGENNARAHVLPSDRTSPRHVLLVDLTGPPIGPRIGPRPATRPFPRRPSFSSTLLPGLRPACTVPLAAAHPAHTPVHGVSRPPRRPRLAAVRRKSTSVARHDPAHTPVPRHDRDRARAVQFATLPRLRHVIPPPCFVLRDAFWRTLPRGRAVFALQRRSPAAACRCPPTCPAKPHPTTQGS